MPTYNRAAYIAAAIESVLAQGLPDVEIVVADDGSTDGTAEVVSSFGDRVAYIPLPHRGQPAAARNAGLAVARGEYVAFLDSDDLYLPGKLARQQSALESSPEAGLVYSDATFFREDPGRPTGRVLDGFEPRSGWLFAGLLRGNFLSTPIVLVRRSCLEVVGRFDERPDFFAVEDYDLWLRVAARYPIVYAPGEVAAIRRHSTGISKQVAELRARKLLVLAKIEAQYPELVRSHRAELHEGYARGHGAVASALFAERKMIRAIRHASRA